MRKAVFWLGGLVALGGLTAVLLWMVTAGSASFRIEGERLLVSGNLTLISTERIDTLVEENPDLSIVVLGEIDPASDATALLQKGALIRSLGLSTQVAPGVTVSGPALYLFLGGVERSLSEDAAIAVSDWQSTLGPASALPPEHPAHDERRLFIAQTLGDEALYAFSLGAAPVGGAHVLSAAELAEFGVLTDG